MHTLLGIAGLVAVAAITPGPNNLIVLTLAAERGWCAALPAIAGVIAGSLVLLLAVFAGAGAAFTALPGLRVALALAGGVYLAWLGIGLMRTAFDSTPERGGAALAAPRGFLGMAAFQWLNPKAWIMVVTAVAALGRGFDAATALLPLAALFALIPFACLLLWSLLGSAMTSLLARPRFAHVFQFAMGLLLVAAVLPLIPR